MNIWKKISSWLDTRKYKTRKPEEYISSTVAPQVKMPEARELYTRAGVMVLGSSNGFTRLHCVVSNISLPDKFVAEDEVYEIVDFDDDLLDSDYLVITASGDLPYDENHPLFDNDLFFRKLLNYLIYKEQYEKCQELIHRRNKVL
jgi:hypothetical protein